MDIGLTDVESHEENTREPQFEDPCTIYIVENMYHNNFPLFVTDNVKITEYTLY